MKRMSLPAMAALLAFTATTAILPVQAHADDDSAKDRAIAKAANLITPEQAAEKALAAKAGTVIEVDLDRGFKGYYYEVEIIDAEAAEWEVHVDAKSGEIRRVRKEWF